MILTPVRSVFYLSTFFVVTYTKFCAFNLKFFFNGSLQQKPFKADEGNLVYKCRHLFLNDEQINKTTNIGQVLTGRSQNLLIKYCPVPVFICSLLFCLFSFSHFHFAPRDSRFYGSVRTAKRPFGSHGNLVGHGRQAGSGDRPRPHKL